MEALFTVLVLCHTVRVERSNDLEAGDYSNTGSEYEYHSPSPDEKALVEACARSVCTRILLKYNFFFEFDIFHILYNLNKQALSYNLLLQYFSITLLVLFLKGQTLVFINNKSAKTF